MLDIIELNQNNLDNTIINGTIGETVIVYAPYTGPDCHQCRPATTGDLQQFWDLVDLTLNQS